MRASSAARVRAGRPRRRTIRRVDEDRALPKSVAIRLRDGTWIRACLGAGTVRQGREAPGERCRGTLALAFTGEFVRGRIADVEGGRHLGLSGHRYDGGRCVAFDQGPPRGAGTITARPDVAPGVRTHEKPPGTEPGGFPASQ